MKLSSDTLLSILTTYGNDIAIEIKENQKLKELLEAQIISCEDFIECGATEKPRTKELLSVLQKLRDDCKI